VVKLLPSNLLRVRVSKGKVRPIYAPLDRNTLGLAEQMIEAYQSSIGRKKAFLIQRLKNFEDEGFDYRFIRGLAALLERRCAFEVESPIDPKQARRMVFEEASRRRAVGIDERENVIRDVSLKLNISPDALEKSLWSDVDEELIVNRFDPLEPAALIKYYNLSLAQTLLFKSLRMEFTASGNWKNIFRAVKRLGLMYSVEQAGEGYIVFLDGPLSLFKMTDRYGTSLAKLLPQIVCSESWRFKADIIGRKKSRIFTFEEKSDDVKGLMEDLEREDLLHPQLYDSTVEERFAKSFNSYNTGWVLRREPEPLLAGKHVLIPDFSFEKYGVKVYLEVVGFWTQEYLERKISKLNSLSDVDIIVAVDESLACSKLQRLRGKVICYSKDVPLRPILDHLRRREDLIVEGQAEVLRRQGIQLKGDIVSIEDLAAAYNVPLESVRRALQGFDVDGYRRIGEYYITLEKVEDLKEKIERLGETKLSEAEAVIEACGLKNPQQVLEAIGYTIVWEGLDYEKSRIKKVA
jgi:predicted nuclease of restriction endonuclease-like RecB superfamily